MKVAGDENPGIAAKHADVFQAPAGHAVGGELVVLVGPFDTQVVPICMGPSLFEQEAAFAGSDFKLHGVGIAEDLAQLDGLGFAGQV